MGEPPFETGALHVSATLAVSGSATGLPGALGGRRTTGAVGVTDAEAGEYAPCPTAFLAATRNS